MSCSRYFGIGISKENFKTVFQRFVRANPNGGVSGLGLGLYIANQIVEAHKGHIRLESEIGVGSTFTVELPMFAPQVPAKPATSIHH